MYSIVIHFFSSRSVFILLILLSHLVSSHLVLSCIVSLFLFLKHKRFLKQKRNLGVSAHIILLLIELRLQRIHTSIMMMTMHPKVFLLLLREILFHYDGNSCIIILSLEKHQLNGDKHLKMMMKSVQLVLKQQHTFSLWQENNYLVDFYLFIIQLKHNYSNYNFCIVTDSVIWFL